MTREEIMQLNTDYLNGCESEHKMNELFNYALEQQSKLKIGRCKDCKYFEYDSVGKVDGMPLIVAHEVCTKWGEGCKTEEDGFCFMFEKKQKSEG